MELQNSSVSAFCMFLVLGFLFPLFRGHLPSVCQVRPGGEIAVEICGSQIQSPVLKFQDARHAWQVLGYQATTRFLKHEEWNRLKKECCGEKCSRDGVGLVANENDDNIASPFASHILKAKASRLQWSLKPQPRPAKNVSNCQITPKPQRITASAPQSTWRCWGRKPG